MGGKKMGDRMNYWAYLKSVLAMIGFLVMACILSSLLSSCKPSKEVMNLERLRVDTLYKSVSVRDSIYVQDSVLIREKGDTILSEKWHLRYVDRWHTDTIYKSKVDTAYIRVEKKASVSVLERVKYFLIDFFSAIALVLLSIFCLYVYKAKLKPK